MTYSRLIGLITLCILTETLTSYAIAESIPSAKFSGKLGGINIIDAKSLGWSPIIETRIRSSSQKELAMIVALECGLFTDTLVKSSGGTQDASSAEAKVNIRVKVNGVVANPGEVIYCYRKQELIAKFGGILESCVDANGDGTIEASECVFTDEELRLIQTTMAANSFNFLLGDLSSGVHRVVVEAKITTGTSAQAGASTAKASIGKGSLLVNQVRAIRNEEFEF